MCDPVSAGLAIASIVASTYAQKQQADAQESMNERTYQSQMTAYNANIVKGNQDYANINATKQQEAEKASQKLIDNNAIARRDMAKATVASGEAGVSGVSVDALLAELGGKAGAANSTVETNYLRTDRALEVDRENVYASGMNNWANTASAINSLKTPVQPDYIGAGLKIGSIGYDMYNPRVSDKRIRG